MDALLIFIALFLFLQFHLDDVVILNDRHEVKQLDDFCEFLIDLVQKILVFKTVPGDFGRKVSSDPGVLESLLSCVSEGWLWVAQFLN
jgi:hypothetical protein